MQAEGEGLMVQSEYGRLHRELWARQHAALERAQPAAVAAAAALRHTAAEALVPLECQPQFVLGSTLHPTSCRHALLPCIYPPPDLRLQHYQSEHMQPGLGHLTARAHLCMRIAAGSEHPGCMPVPP